MQVGAQDEAAIGSHEMIPVVVGAPLLCPTGKAARDAEERAVINGA